MALHHFLKKNFLEISCCALIFTISSGILIFSFQDWYFEGEDYTSILLATSIKNHLFLEKLNNSKQS